MNAYYNDSDPFRAQWLRNLGATGAIPAGTVDERSIADIDPGDLAGYRHCHFFAGIGGFAYALRLAGWDMDRPVWTGSAPCQPFSSAGRQGGALDERHLWPRWLRLIRECRPDTILGEQVEGAVGFGWIDRVSADLEAEGYACGQAVLGAHSVGAPHIRQRLFWVAHAPDDGWRTRGGDECRREGGAAFAHNGSTTGGVADADEAGSDRERRARLSGNADAPQRHDADRCGEIGGLGNADRERSQGCANGSVEAQGWDAEERQAGLSNGGVGHAAGEQMGRARQPWQDSVWLPCLDGKARRTQRCIQPLASRLPTAMDGLGSVSRVGALKGAGNSIVPQVAAEFIQAVMECIP